MLKDYILALVLFTITVPGFSQGFKLLIPDPVPRDLKISAESSYTDSVELIEYLHQIRSAAITKGYLTFSVDNLAWDKNTATASLFFGEKYRWGEIRKGDVPEEFLSQVGFKEKLYRNAKLNPAEIARLQEELLSYAENHGYPFAEVGLDEVEIGVNQISAGLFLEKNNHVVIDSVIIKGNLETNREYILSYLNLQPGKPYNQAQIQKITNRCREIPFVQMVRPYELGMHPGKVDVYLYLDSKKASNFSGIIGVLPDENSDKILITGDIELNLMNALKRGETINFNWQKLQTNTQELYLHAAYPFLFKTPVGIEAELNLYRQDTIFSQVGSNIGLQYLLNGGDFVKVFVQNESSNVLSAEYFSLDQYSDTKTLMFGVGTNVSDLDYRFNPRAGYQIVASVAAGTKNILKDPAIDEEEYTDVQLKSDIYNINFSGRYFIPLMKRATILFKGNSGYFLNDNMFKNDMYRIGGLKTLRGFNEQSIYASFYAVATAEFRYILEQNSNLFIFFDQGYYEDRSINNPVVDNPYGFGAGVNFETKAGIFSLTYALGKQFENPIEVRNGKVHFGFVSLF